MVLLREHDAGGARASAADPAPTSDGGDGSQSPASAYESSSYQIVEWRQSTLPEFFDVKDAAAVWATLERIEQRSHWWKVEILKQVDAKQWMNEFLSELRESHGIELSKRYANELRQLGHSLDELGARAPTLRERIEELPVTTAIKTIRAEDLETAVEVAESESQKELEKWLQEEKLAAADPLAPIQLRLFNSWNFSDAIHGSPEYAWGYNSGHITENLLWYYTEPDDLVIDPMVGSGTTIDACERMQRRCLGYDKDENILTGIATDEPAQLIFLDPPFYTLKHNEYDSYDDFIEFVDKAIDESVKVLREGGYLALIMMNLCDSKERRAMIGDCYELLKKKESLAFENMILSPLSTQQASAGRAKKNRQLLNIARIVWVFRRVVP